MITPNWPAPPSVKALSFTKKDSLDELPAHFHDSILKQIHAADVITLPAQAPLVGDAAYTTQKNSPCIIRTADCLAILLCNQSGTEVAALHGGWRGLAAGIIEKTLVHFQSPPSELMAWLSPAICAKHYEIDASVYHAFVDHHIALSRCFTHTRPGHWQADLFHIARMQLNQCGVQAIFGGDVCTYENASELYSYRRDPTDPGRLLHAIWMV